MDAIPSQPYSLFEYLAPGCFEILTFYNSGSPQSWFCLGIGVIESQYHHAGTPFGYAAVLLDYFHDRKNGK
jgi:hypothetical protein